MKKIALILAVVMMLSAVSVFAAPSVEHIFYGVDDETGIPAFYVFGKYTNNSTKSGTQLASDVGVYYNGEKYSYVKDGNTTSKAGLYGIAFDDIAGVKGSMKSFKVQPYSVNKFGEKLGAEQEYDFVNNEKKLSSNANLASVAIIRAQPNKGGLMASMEPAFDPDITEYTIYGSFANATNNNLTNVKLLLTAEDPNAIISEPVLTSNRGDNAHIIPTQNFDENGEYANYLTVTVTAENKETKTYKFNFHTYDRDKYYSTTSSNVARPTEYISVGYDGTSYSTATNNNNLYAFPLASFSSERYLVYTFNIVDGMKSADVISLSTSNVYAENLDGAKNIVLAARAYDDTTKLGKVGGTFVIPKAADVSTDKTATNDFCPCGIDVTSIVKDAIKANQTTVKIALQIIDIECDNTANTPALRLIRHNNTTTYNPNYSVSLCWE